jgi:hypothetical protein
MVPDCVERRHHRRLGIAKSEAVVKLLSLGLVGVGLATIAGAVWWWVDYYRPIVRQTGHTLGDAFPCLFRSSGSCGLVSGISQLLGESPYTPEPFWIGVGLVALGLIAAIAGAFQPARRR